MTRQEAIFRAIKTLGCEDEQAIRQIELLESLGLLKLDPPHGDPMAALMKHFGAIDARRAIDDLAAAGYTIVKSRTVP